MHQLAEGKEIRGENGDEKKVDVEESAQLSGYDGPKAHKAHDQLFHPLYVRLKEMAHEHSGEQIAPRRKRAKIVGRQRNEAQLRREGPPDKRYVAAAKIKHVAYVKRGHPDLEEAVEPRDCGNTGRMGPIKKRHAGKG